MVAARNRPPAYRLRTAEPSVASTRGHSADSGWRARPGGPGGPAQHLGQRLLHFLGQPRGPVARFEPARRAHRAHSDRRLRRDRGVRHRTAIPALHLAEPSDQMDARAHRTPVQVRGPVVGRLTAGADQHLAIGANAAPPGTDAPVWVNLPRAAAITRHLPPVSEFLPGPSRARPAPAGSQRYRGLAVSR
jgi:hypothetical protein